MSVRGEIESFDEEKGYGFVRADDGQQLFFHCTQLADGTRTIDAGAAVEFEVVPGRGGRWEAARVTPAGAEA